MANDRLLLVCKCGQAVSIYKYYPSGGYETSERRQDWIDEHMKSCHSNPYGPDLGHVVPFTLRTETCVDGEIAHITDGVYFLK